MENLLQDEEDCVGLGHGLKMLGFPDRNQKVHSGQMSGVDATMLITAMMMSVITWAVGGEGRSG